MYDFLVVPLFDILVPGESLHPAARNLVEGTSESMIKTKTTSLYLACACFGTGN